MNKTKNALKGSKGQQNFRKKLLWLIVSALGILIMPFLAVFQLIILIRRNFPRIKGGFMSLGMLFLAAGSYFSESLSKVGKKTAVSSKS